jgi:drug/metabolite transporter (DMT)-like permease
MSDQAPKSNPAGFSSNAFIAAAVVEAIIVMAGLTVYFFVDANVLWGDCLLVGAGAMWAATTLIVKASRIREVPAEKGLIYQVALSIPILAVGAMLFGERIERVPGPLAVSLVAYQAVWVVGLTFLIWFVLVKAYSASKLSAFTFITPLFGVLASYFILHDTLTPVFGAAAILVITGLYLVNRSAPEGARIPSDPLLSATET